MNMKKTIAALAAGSVAVSAMATTVSALEAKTLTYSLVQNVRQNNASGTITYTFNTVPVAAGQTVEITAVGAGPWACVVTVSGSYQDVNQSIQPTKFTKRDWTDAYDHIPAQMIEGSGNDSVVKIPVVEGISGGKATNLPAGTIKNLTVTVDYFNLPASVGYTGALNSEIIAGNRGIKLGVKSADGGEVGATNATAAFAPAATGATAQLTVKDQAKLNSIAPQDATKTYSWDSANSKWVGEAVPAKATVKAFQGTDANAVLTTNTPVTFVASSDVATALTAAGTYQLTCTTAGQAAASEWTIVEQNGAVATVSGKKGVKIGDGDVAAIKGDVIIVEVTAAIPGADAPFSAADLNAALDITNLQNGDKITITKYTPGVSASVGGYTYQSDIAGAAVSVSGQTAREIPYRSSLKNSTNITYYTSADGKKLISNNAIGGGDVFWKIGLSAANNADVVGDGDVWDYYWANGYVDQSGFSGNQLNTTGVNGNSAIRYWNEAQTIATNAKAVVNDAIQNYSDVTFVFNTAAKNVKVWTNAAGEVVDYEYTGDGATTVRELDGNHSNDMVQILDFTSFGRHYWDRDTGYDANTLYISNEWLGNNLFEGALIVNNNLTLSLGATDKFDWTSTSLSFSWDAIQDAALTNNAYANYVQNMVLRTSSDWYWDNMQVVLGATEDEDVGTTSPVEAEEEELEEVEPEVEAEPEAEPEEEPAVDVEPEPEVAPAANPGTGNAPVALAVIPVALAAAAIVAKKRG